MENFIIRYPLIFGGGVPALIYPNPQILFLLSLHDDMTIILTESMKPKIDGPGLRVQHLSHFTTDVIPNNVCKTHKMQQLGQIMGY